MRLPCYTHTNRLPRRVIRHGASTLAVPAVHPATPSAVRVRIYELVLKRLYSEAADLAAETAAGFERRSVERSRLAEVA